LSVCTIFLSKAQQADEGEKIQSAGEGSSSCDQVRPVPALQSGTTRATLLVAPCLAHRSYQAWNQYLRPGRDGRFTASTTLPKENFRILFSSKGMAAASFSDFSTLDLQERLKDSVGDIQSEAGETEVSLKLQGHQRSLPKNGPAYKFVVLDALSKVHCARSRAARY
jgi:hypothetical protein